MAAAAAGAIGDCWRRKETGDRVVFLKLGKLSAWHVTDSCLFLYTCDALLLLLALVSMEADEVEDELLVELNVRDERLDMTELGDDCCLGSR